MYPKNAASPERIAIGAVVQISDGAVQSSGCTVRVIPQGGVEADGGGTTAYSTDGVVLYTPTQAETNYSSFVLIAKKTGCIPVSVTVVTTNSATAGMVNVGAINSISAASVAAIGAYIGNATAALAVDASGRVDLGKWIGTAPLALSSQQVQAVVPDAQKVDLNTIKTQAVTCSGGVTVPAATLASTTNITAAAGCAVSSIGNDAITAAAIATGAIDADAIADDAIDAGAVAAGAVTKIQTGLATPTNITAGTITTVTNVTNAPTSGDLTATMKTSVETAVANQLNTAIPGSPTANSINERVKAIDDLTQASGGGDLAAIKGYVDDIGVAGAGLTALGDARLANLDAAISTRTKPADTQAAVTIVNGLANNVITSASIQDGAITNAKVADDVDVNAKTVSTGAISATAFAAGAIDAASLAADAGTEIANAIKAAVVESQGNYTVQQVLSIVLAVLAGVTSSGGATLKTPNGSATRVAATIDGSNNRTAMTLTPSA